LDEEQALEVTAIIEENEDREETEDGGPRDGGRWQKGRSGNPRGRPPNSRALAAILRDIGDAKANPEAAESITFREYMAVMLWGAVRDGVVRLGDGRRIQLNGKDWFEIVKWVQQQVEPQTKQVREVRYIGVANDPAKHKRDNRPLVFTWGED
jgi:hypothetical protein